MFLLLIIRIQKVAGLETAGKGKKAQAPAEIPGGTVSGSKEPLLPYSCRLSSLAYGMEKGLRPGYNR